LLIEVLVSALIVALIVVATFNGFDVATRLTADQRFHSEAELLAAESQEQLRSDPATALDALESTSHSYTKTLGSETFTVTQEAKPVKASGSATGCSATESSKENGANIEITSSVTWPQLVSLKRPAVKQASIITPPVGSALEIDVTNGAAPPAGVGGVTGIARFVPVGSGTAAAAEGTTSSNGCVILTGLAATTATVEIVEKLYYVTTGGDLKYPTKEVTIAPNITTQYPVTYTEGGRITAEFSYKGSTSWEGKPVTGDTFVVANSKIPAGDQPFQVGSTAFEYESSGEQNYLALPGSTTGNWATSATTATAPKYARGDLFPFPQNWTVYAGDCPKNDTGSEAEVEGGAKVVSGSAVTVKVPMSYVNLTASSGTYSKPGSAESTEYPVLITNTECEGYGLPNNAYAGTVAHAQLTNTSGHLAHPFQPFGKQTLCLFSPTTKRTFTTTYTNSTAAGTTRNAYLGQASKAERETVENEAKAKREAEESAANAAKATRESEEKAVTPAKEKRAKEETEAKTAKEKRVKEETEAKTAKEKREKEEAEAPAAKVKREKEETEQTTARVAREAKEKEEREKWLSEEKAKKISKKERESKESTQTTTRKTDEGAEKTAREKRAKEEAEAKTAKEKRETEEVSAKLAKEKREAEEVSAALAKEKREKEEAEVKPAKEKREKEEAEAKAPREKRQKEETEAAANKPVHEKEEKEAEEKTGFTVASGKTSC